MRVQALMKGLWLTQPARYHAGINGTAAVLPENSPLTDLPALSWEYRFSRSCQEVPASQGWPSELWFMGAGGEEGHRLGGGGQAGGGQRGSCCGEVWLLARQRELSEICLPTLQHTRGGQGRLGLFLTSRPADPAAGRAEADSRRPDAKSLSSHCRA